MTYARNEVALSDARRRAARAIAATPPDRRRTLLLAGLAAGAALAAAWFAVSPAMALSMHECSARYKAAQSAGTLGGMTWNEFRKTRCADAVATAAPAAQAPAPAAAAPAAPAPAPAAAPAARSQTAPVRAGGPVFPTAVSPKYASEKPARQRMKTCLDQYNANKATNANGGMKWIQKGGGYYSECNRRLKG
ncbi:hypothetical protein ACFFJB_09855 [Camelimonas abortus]|uniref:hypothetical protein n=1 Tax=Camelimonas abortus TaxID=1017184 RepID=UPI0035E6BA57